MFKKVILYFIVGLITFQIFPLQWATDISFYTDIEQSMAMNDADDDDFETEFSKVVKDKTLDNYFHLNILDLLSNKNIVHTIVNNTELQKLCSRVICPPPNQL